MYRMVVVSCLLWFVGVTAGLQCTPVKSPALKFSVTSRRNETGQWIAQVQLGHEAGQKDAGPWEVDIDHTVTKCRDIESVLIVATLKAPRNSYQIPPGYELVPGFGYYKLHTDLKNWQDALKACEQEGTHLLIINSEEEAKALTFLWDKNPKIVDGPRNDWAHIGSHDIYKEGQYLTIFNETLPSAGYVKWFPGEPTGDTSQNCGVAIRRQNLLGDIPCDYKQPYFCERSL